MVCTKHKSGVLRLTLAGNAALCAERSRNDSILCCKEHKLHSHVQPSFVEQGTDLKGKGAFVAKVFRIFIVMKLSPMYLKEKLIITMRIMSLRNMSIGSLGKAEEEM